MKARIYKKILPRGEGGTPDPEVPLGYVLTPDGPGIHKCSSVKRRVSTSGFVSHIQFLSLSFIAVVLTTLLKCKSCLHKSGPQERFVFSLQGRGTKFSIRIRDHDPKSAPTVADILGKPQWVNWQTHACQKESGQVFTSGGLGSSQRREALKYPSSHPTCHLRCPNHQQVL